MIHYKLNDGNKIPAIGLGVYMQDSEQTEKSVGIALENGYRLVDTANLYENECAVGRAINNSKVERKKIFVTSKLWPDKYKYEDAIEAVEDTLERMNLAYIDLFLLHQPFKEYMEAWRALEYLTGEGKIKSIGLSNFYGEELDDVLENSVIKPAVIQSECQIYYQQKELKEKIKKYGIVLESWFPLGHGDKKMLTEPLLLELSQKYKKSTTQILLRWQIQMGNVVIPGGKSEDHIKANIDIFNFKIEKEDMDRLATLDCGKSYNDFPEPILKAAFLAKHPNPENDI